jgi:DNA-binding transcriptional ArsR family regulator
VSVEGLEMMREEIETGLGNKNRLKILRLLAKDENALFTKYAIQKLTRLNPRDVRSNVKLLVEINWVKELPYEPLKYGINLEHPSVRHLLDFFHKTRYI